MKILMSLTLFFGMLGISQAMELTVKNLDQIKLACAGPGVGGNQKPITTIELFCSEIITTWLASLQGVLLLPKSDSMKTSATTDKPNVGSAEEVTQLPAVDYPADCPKYNEVKLTASMLYPLTCQEVEGITNLAVYCKEKFKLEYAANPSFYTITPTGVVKDTCVGVTINPVAPIRRREVISD